MKILLTITFSILLATIAFSQTKNSTRNVIDTKKTSEQVQQPNGIQHPAAIIPDLQKVKGPLQQANPSQIITVKDDRLQKITMNGNPALILLLEPVIQNAGPVEVDTNQKNPSVTTDVNKAPLKETE